MEERRKLTRRTDDRMLRAAYEKLKAELDAGGASGARKLLRRAIRHHCTVQIALTGGFQSGRGDVWSPVQMNVKGRMLDLSGSGCSIFTRDAFEVGARVGLNIVLDKEGGVHAEAVARWGKALPEKGGYATGFQFNGLSRDDERKLDSFLRRMDETAGL
ncbi:MAG: hypothetical protein RLZZ303_55 [Candidatus Hydrogenedentota bacterium]|jgi:hypothetical protein